MDEGVQSASGFDAGVERGLERASRYDLEVPFEAIEDTLSRARDEVIGHWPTALSDRFQEIFAENLTVASIARVRYEDRPLDPVDMRAFLGHSEVFFNSLTHDE